MKPKNYRSTHKSESIEIDKVSPPFKIVDGTMVHAVHDGVKWVWPELE